MAATPFVLQDTQQVSYSLMALDADGNPTTLATGDVMNVSSSDTASATIVPDAVSPVAGTVASGMIVGGSKLGTVQISAAVTHADGSAGASGTVSIQIVAGAAATISFALGTASPQSAGG